MTGIIISVAIGFAVFAAVMWNFYSTIDELERRIEEIEKGAKKH